MNRIEKNYLDALINDKGPDAVMKAIKDLEAADRLLMKGPNRMKRYIEPVALVLLCILFFFIGMGYGERQLKKAEATAYQQGYKDALYKRPVSEELDMVCAGLWIGKEDLKYQQREMQK